jgi:NAD(P)-dependent dehydrogenase (short-subunit alcohol dehydrogenase family)
VNAPIIPRRWTAGDIPDQAGRIAIVTGANSGLGLRTAEALAARGARVLMACRDQEKAAAAWESVASAATGPKPEILALDLADLASVRTAAAHVADTVDRVDVLVNNAGVMATPRTTTVDGFDTQFGTNHLGHYALTGLLLPTLRRAPAPRVVSVASVAAWFGMLWPDPNWRRFYQRWLAYGQSKFANLLFTAELDRRARAEGSTLTALAAHPGVSATNLYRLHGDPRGVGKLIVQTRNSLSLATAQSDRLGALPQLYAATMPDIAGNTYIGPAFELAGYPRRTVRNPLAHSRRRAARLWRLSEELTGVRYDWSG